MVYNGPQNFFCDACTQSILSINPRVHCLICHDYDLCPNCALAERFTEGHVASHPTQLYKKSGGGAHYPVLSPHKVTYNNVPATVPLPNDQALNPTCDQESQPPPPPYPGNDVVAVSAPPPITNAVPASSGWQPFFSPDMTPSSTYMTLMNDIFSYLDPSDSGHLLPETFERYLKDMRNLPDGLHSLSSDKDLKIDFDSFSIDYKLLPRVQARPNDPASSVPSMPAITRRGLIKVSAIQMLAAPTPQWGKMSNLLCKYDLPRYRGWGELPRSVLPATPYFRVNAEAGKGEWN